ncbi:YraN family protein [Flavitalea sp.]|nr:YraN family protein [Flavitalea sp.]
MRDHLVTGKKGEEFAAIYIANLGFQILERNWRYRRFEIDIIASRSDVLHFIEVKTRTSTVYGYPEEGVSNKKIRSLIKGGANFLYKNPGWQHIQYDILSILLVADTPPDFLFIQDVYL